VVATVFPIDAWDKLILSGYHAEVWMESGVNAQNIYEHMAEFYRAPASRGKVALVLGAGNVANIGPMDALYKLFAEGQVVVLKMNPVNEYLGPILREAFEDFVKGGFFEVVYGGAEEGEYLCNHALVDEIHITGSDKTHDAIMFGAGFEGAQRKERHQ